jgi:hypothetical protein
LSDLKGLREDLEGSIRLNRFSSFVSASKAAHAFESTQILSAHFWRI